MSDVVLWCFRHKQEVRKGKRACEYRLIWNLDVKSEVIGECDMRDAVVVPVGDGDMWMIDLRHISGDGQSYIHWMMQRLQDDGVLLKVERGDNA